jgi:hypothetical protein
MKSRPVVVALASIAVVSLLACQTRRPIDSPLEAARPHAAPVSAPLSAPESKPQPASGEVEVLWQPQSPEFTLVVSGHRILVPKVDIAGRDTLPALQSALATARFDAAQKVVITGPKDLPFSILRPVIKTVGKAGCRSIAIRAPNEPPRLLALATDVSLSERNLLAVRSPNPTTLSLRVIIHPGKLTFGTGRFLNGDAWDIPNQQGRLSLCGPGLETISGRCPDGSLVGTLQRTKSDVPDQRQVTILAEESIQLGTLLKIFEVSTVPDLFPEGSLASVWVDEAADAAARLVRHAPYLEPFYVPTGVLDDPKDPAKVQAALEKASKSLRADADSYVVLGNLQMRAGKAAEALALFDKALALEPHHALAHGSKGLALLAAKKDADAARKELGLALDDGRDLDAFPAASIALADVQFKQDWEGATQTYADALLGLWYIGAPRERMESLRDRVRDRLRKEAKVPQVAEDWMRRTEAMLVTRPRPVFDAPPEDR